MCNRKKWLVVLLFLMPALLVAKPYTQQQIESMRPALHAIFPESQIKVIDKVCYGDNLCHCIQTNSEAKATLGRNWQQASSICDELRSDN